MGQRIYGCIIGLLLTCTSHAQNVPNATGKCVYNCDAPAAPARGSTRVAPTTAPLTDFGSRLGTTIGRSLVGGNQAPQNSAGQTEAAQQYLDGWEKEDTQKRKTLGDVFR